MLDYLILIYLIPNPINSKDSVIVFFKDTGEFTEIVNSDKEFLYEPPSRRVCAYRPLTEPPSALGSDTTVLPVHTPAKRKSHIIKILPIK